MWAPTRTVSLWWRSVGLVAFLGAAGCGSSVGKGTPEPTETGGASTGGGGQSGAGAAGGGANGAAGGVRNDESYAIVWNCPVPKPCRDVQTITGEANVAPDPEAIRCVLTAMRDGTPGRYVVGTTQQVGFGSGSNSATVYLVHADRTLDTSGVASSAGMSTFFAASHCELGAPERYDACLSELDAMVDAGPNLGPLGNCALFDACVPSAGVCP